MLHFGNASDQRVFHLITSIGIPVQQPQHTILGTFTYNPPYPPPTMLHKRKRSSTTILSSPTTDLPSSSISISTVQSFYPHTKPVILSPFHSPSKPSSSFSLFHTPDIFYFAKIKNFSLFFHKKRNRKKNLKILNGIELFC
jgi:hypothetical protein